MVSVTLDQVTKRFDSVVAVDRVSLEIQKGEFFFLLGPSGCGKTTLLRLVAGFYRPDGGRLLFGDRDVTTVPPNQRNTGMVFQNYALWPHMSVRKNVEYGLALRSVNRKEMDERVDRALDMVQMRSYAERSPNQLSGGQQQRVALARALVIEPDVVLMDEPLSNLDARLRIEMRQHIQDLQRKIGTTMIYVTHDQKEALAMSDRMAVMDQGRVVQVGAPRDLYQRPGTRFVADFIGEINLIPGKIASTDGGVSVTTALGEVRSTAPSTLGKGEAVLCAVRPEAAFLLSGEPAPGLNLLSGTVRNVIYLGDVEQYLVRLPGDEEFRVLEHDPSARRALAGDPVRVAFDPSRVVVLPDPRRGDAQKV